MAESKRAFVFGERWNTNSGIGIGAINQDIFMANAFGFLAVGAGDEQFTGNEILDPMVALKLSVRINWGPLSEATGVMPTIRVDAYLIAVNDQHGSTVTPRLTSLAEDAGLFMRWPDMDMNWMMNSQSVTVIKRKRVMFSPRDVNSVLNVNALETRTVKIAKRLKGKKEFETSFATNGSQSRSPYLKGYNYYWLVVTQGNANYAAAPPSGINPIVVGGDRYVYYKDF